MMTWAEDELRKISGADDLHISPFREDGSTYGTPTWIWSVAVDDGLYMRASNGQQSRWYRAAIMQKSGRFSGAGLTKEVGFESVDGSPPIEEVRPGDVVRFPPAEKHWHGATPTTAMRHIAIQEALDGKAVDWLEHVSDEQYRE